MMRRLVRLLPALLILTGAEAQELSALGGLGEELANWKTQIEEAGGGTVVVARVQYDQERDRVLLPADVEFASVLARYLRTPAFVSALAETHGLNLNYQGPEGFLHFILLNVGRAKEWGPYEGAVLAHEYGHVWLRVNDYPAPLYDGGENSCAAIVAGDAVQHIAIRKELSRRGIPYLPYWISKLETTLEVLDAGFHAPMSHCRLLTLLGEWLDVRLGLTPDEWEGYDRFLAAIEGRFPMLAGEVEALYALLAGQDAEDTLVHERLLRQVLDRVYQLAERLAEDIPVTAAGAEAPPY